MNSSKELGGATVDPAAVSGATPSVDAAGKYKALPLGECPFCRCRSFAKVDMPTLGGEWDNSKIIRCVECKRDFAAPDAWFPIESAPKDESRVWLFGVVTQRDGYYSARRAVIGEWSKHREGWVPVALCAMADHAVTPTHWQPLPQPPVSGRESDERIAGASQAHLPNDQKSGAS